MIYTLTFNPSIDYHLVCNYKGKIFIGNFPTIENYDQTSDTIALKSPISRNYRFRQDWDYSVKDNFTSSNINSLSFFNFSPI